MGLLRATVRAKVDRSDLILLKRAINVDKIIEGSDTLECSVFWILHLGPVSVPTACFCARGQVKILILI